MKFRDSFFYNTVCVDFIVDVFVILKEVHHANSNKRLRLWLWFQLHKFGIDFNLLHFVKWKRDLLFSNIVTIREAEVH